MTITHNGITYELTTPQLHGLRGAAMMPSGAFSMERRNEKTEEKLAGMGLIVEDYAYRDPEERRVKVDSARLDLERALTALESAPDIEEAEARANAAMWELRALLRKRYYLTEAGYAVVLRAFPIGAAFVPARFQHLIADYPAYNAQ